MAFYFYCLIKNIVLKNRISSFWKIVKIIMKDKLISIMHLIILIFTIYNYNINEHNYKYI